MIDANFKSALYLKNVVETDPITVTPILWLSNGTRYTLPNVTLEPAGTAVVDINAGLQQKGISPWATLSGYVELQYTWPWDPICATIRDTDTVDSLIFTYGLQWFSAAQHPNSPAATQSAHVIEGMWWKQESNVTGFVALANISSQPTRATVLVTDSLGKGLMQHSVTVSPHGMKVVNLRELQQTTNPAGGIRVTYTGPENTLLINGGLQDQSVGYSALLPFSVPQLSQSEPPKASAMTVAELGLMAGAADPMMLFPSGTTFTPYSVLRNVSDAPISVTPTLWWMEAGAAHSARLQQIGLLPYQTQSLDVKSLLSISGLKDFNGSFNVVIEGETMPGALLLAPGSVDQTNTYVFEVPPRAVGESAAKSLSYWSVGNGDDTMVTLWNPADEAQDLVFRLVFSGGHYALPIHLEPKATRAFNISEVIQNQIPDAEGNSIPTSVHEGSAKIVGSHADNENILVAMESGIYNVRKATCEGTNCYTCDGWTGTSILASPFGVAVSSTNQLNWTLTWDTGGQYNYNGSGTTWYSSNTGVAAVQTGLVHGVSPGSPQITTSNATTPVYVPYHCVNGYVPCPQGAGGGTNGNVTPTVSVSCSNLDLSLGSTAPSSTVTGTCTVTPKGGSFSWSKSGSTITLTPSPDGTSASYASAAASSSKGDTTITVKYTVKDQNNNNQSASSSSGAITVHQPKTLVPSSVAANGTAPCTLACLTNPVNKCNVVSGTSCTYTANQFQREYKVYDQFNTFFQSVGINNATVTESISLTSNNCGGSGVGTGSSTYTDFFDDYGKCDSCCEKGGPGCTTTAAQTIFVNGYSVWTDTITETCTTATATP